MRYMRKHEPTYEANTRGIIAKAVRIQPHCRSLYKYGKDTEGTTYMYMNLVDSGTWYQTELPIREGHGTPPRRARTLD